MARGNEFLNLWYLLFLTVPAALVMIAITIQFRLRLEKGQRSLLTQTTNGTIGVIHYYFPFIRVSLYADFLVIRTLQTIVLHYTDIDRVNLTVVFGIFNEGVQIIHHGSAPMRIIIKTDRAVQIKQIIEARMTVKPPIYIEPQFRLR